VFNFLRRFYTLEIYTDGSSKDGVGSWAYVISRRGQCLGENSGRVRRASSNAMEFQAAIEALTSIPCGSNVILFTDSKILVDTIISGKGHASFQPQMDLLFPLTQIHTITWRWIKAHNGNKFNERCDELCTLIHSR
jgi:ribonuclease HI